MLDLTINKICHHENNINTFVKIKELISSQKLAALATQSINGPYINLVAYCAADDLKYICFATSRTTRKFGNLQNTPQAALMVNNSKNQISDFNKAMAVSILGQAIEVFDDERNLMEKEYLERHSNLDTFVKSETCALIKFEVELYILVENFQNITEYHVKSNLMKRH
ncbi:MAG: pyridoxamine 5'-phosphate oxidase family protein [Desulfobacterales bacterium]|nr:pyridoxamine 5'-phosphate oxidase family protein [Desulfobacterales bacterium]